MYIYYLYISDLYLSEYIISYLNVKLYFIWLCKYDGSKIITYIFGIFSVSDL